VDGWVRFVDFYEAFCVVGAEGFRFKYVPLESCGISILLWFIDSILKSFCWVCIDRLEVIFSYEVLYFHVVVLNRKNDYIE